MLYATEMRDRFWSPPTQVVDGVECHNSVGTSYVLELRNCFERQLP